MKKILNCYCWLLITIPGLPGNLLSQNTGVGMALPLEKLHVGGNIKADTVKPNAVKILSAAGAGKILTSDAIGNGTWQTNNVLTGSGNVGFGFWGDCATNANISEYNPITSDTIGGGSFGSSVFISGNYAIVGDPSAFVGTNANQGNASIFQYNGGNWVLMQKLTDVTGAPSDRFGISVSISGNIAIVGADGDDVGANTNQGSACIYQFNGTSWVLMQKITDATGAAGDQFGATVAISGNYAIAGAPMDDVGAISNQGSASTYQFNGTSWVLMQKLIDAAGSINELFGYSVSLSGSYAVIGAILGKVATNVQQGYADVYQLNGGAWVFMQKLTDPGGTAGDAFGNSVSISGNTIIVGDYGDNVGSNFGQGSASIFEYNGTTWVWAQRLVDIAGEATDWFGYSVAVSGNYAIVGAFFDNVGIYPDRGSATIYQRVGLGWSKLQLVTDPAGIGSFSNGFGKTTAIEGTGKRFLIGCGTGKGAFGKIN